MVLADTGSSYIGKREEMNDYIETWFIVQMCGKRKQLNEASEVLVKTRSGMRAYVEHLFRFNKR